MVISVTNSSPVFGKEYISRFLIDPIYPIKTGLFSICEIYPALAAAVCAIFSTRPGSRNSPFSTKILSSLINNPEREMVSPQYNNLSIITKGGLCGINGKIFSSGIFIFSIARNYNNCTTAPGIFLLWFSFLLKSRAAFPAGQLLFLPGDIL
jgi:hypothetical protein